jgi:hypothetical protein
MFFVQLRIAGDDAAPPHAAPLQEEEWPPKSQALRVALAGFEVAAHMRRQEQYQ